MRSNNARGATLLEALIAIVVVGILIMAAVETWQWMENVAKENISLQLCKAHLRDVFVRMELPSGVPGQSFTKLEADPYKLSFDFAPIGGKIRPTGPPVNGLRPLGLNPRFRWPNRPDYNTITRSPVPTIANSHLVYSPMNTLASLYNSNPNAYCNSPNGAIYNDPDGIFTPYAPPGSLAANNRLHIQIRPFDLATGDVAPTQMACPTGPIIPRPVGVQLIEPGGLSPDGGFRYGPNNHWRYGFEVTLNSQYRVNDKPDACLLSRRFSYVPDRVRPASPEIAIVANNHPQQPTCLNANPRRMIVTVTAPLVQEPGSILLCKDNSIQLVAPACSAASIAPQIPSAGPYLDTRWKPCDLVTLCGRNQRGPTVLNLIGPNLYRAQYRMSFQNLPYNCMANLVAATVDSAGNLSVPANLSIKIEVPKPAPGCDCP